MMDINEIREYLPHRYPFLLVDRVAELDIEGKTIRAYKNVSINEPFFNGHFPEHPENSRGGVVEGGGGVEGAPPLLQERRWPMPASS